MTLYHAIEILLVAAIVGSCSVAVGKHFLPNLREWLHPMPPGETDKSCSNGGCNGCAPNGKALKH